MKPVKIIILVSTLLVLMTASSEAGWLVYHEPEFKGTILDISTKQPIEGAVVVAIYSKATIGLGAGTISSIINVRETLTDKEGNFRIPSYTTLIQPFSWQIPNRVIIFKPGYASLETGTGYFIGEELMKEQAGSWWWSKDLKYRLRGRGIVELPLLRTREERIKATYITITGYGSKDLPLLYKVLNEECQQLNIPGYY